MLFTPGKVLFTATGNFRDGAGILYYQQNSSRRQRKYKVSEMSNFYVKSSQLKNSAGNIGQVQRSVRLISSDVQSVIKSLDKSRSTYAEIARNLDIDWQNIQRTENTLGKMKAGAERIAVYYQTTENEITGHKSKAGAKTGAAKKGNTGAIAGVWDRFNKMYKHRVDREKAMYEGLAKGMKDTFAWWSDHKKQVIETGKAVATIAGSAVSIAALWGIGGLTAGAATPVAALGTIYAGDAILNSLHDIADIWGGNEGYAGKHHALQDAIKEGGSELGKMVGNEKLGETLGNGVYYGGKTITTIAEIGQLAGDIHEAPDLVREVPQTFGEVRQGFGGMIDIVTHTPITQLKYDLKLLSYEVPHTAKVIHDVGLLVDVGSHSYDIFDAGVSYITDMFDCNNVAVAAH